MDVDEERRRKIEEGRRRLEKLRSKKESEKNAVHAAKKPLPSPFASAARKPPPEFKLPEIGRKPSSVTPREGAANKENVPGRRAQPESKEEEKKMKQTPPPQHDEVTKDQQLVRDMLGSAGDFSDPKTIDAEIQKLRDLDRSYDRSYTPQLPAKAHRESEASAQQQQNNKTPPDPQPAGTMAHAHAGPTSASEPAQAQPQEPATRMQEGPAINTPAVASTLLIVQESSAPPGYLSPSKLTGAASRGVHFGTGADYPKSRTVSFVALVTEI